MLTVYATDDISVVNFNECLLAAGWETNGSQYGYVLNSSWTGEGDDAPRIALHMRLDSDNKHDVEESHILLHQWVLDMLHLRNGDTIELLPVDHDLADTNKPVVKTVDLHFTAALSLLNYDEYTLAAGGSDRGSSIAFTLPGTWQSQWPGFSVPVLKIMLSTLLHNACIVDGGHVCINVLEHYMVFQTNLKLDEAALGNMDTSNCFIVKDFEIDFDITFTSEENMTTTSTPESQSNSVNVVTLSYHIIPCMESAFTRLSRIMLNSTIPSFNNNNSNNITTRSEGDAWLGPHSALLMAPRGAGKTHLLRSLLAHLTQHAADKQQKEETGGKRHDRHVVFSLSGECLNSLSSGETSNVSDVMSPFSKGGASESASAASSVSNSPQHVLFLVQRLIKALPSAQPTAERGTNMHSYHDQLQTIVDCVADTGQLPPVCIMIDNADSLIITSENSSSSTSSADMSADSKLASFFLQQLLAVISSPVCSHPICVLATTSLTLQADVAPAFLGPPGFEAIVTLPLPNYIDRCLLLKCFFEAICGGDQNLTSILGDLPMSFASLDHHADNNKSSYKGNNRENKHSINKNVENTADVIWSESLCASELIYDWVCRASSLTAGYLPADLKHITRRAMGLSTGRAIGLSTAEARQQGQVEGDSSRQLLWVDFLAALTATTPNQLRSVGTSEGGGGGGIVVESRDSSLSWDNFAGYTEQKEAISHILERSNPLYGMKKSLLRKRHPQKHKIVNGEGRSDLEIAVGHQAPKGLILHGPSGCGKSHMARIIAAECQMNFVTVKSTALLSKYFGETEATLRKLFQTARDAAPCVLFFDEFDAIAHNRSESGDGESSVMARVLSTFLNELDGISSLSTSSSTSNVSIGSTGGNKGGMGGVNAESEFNVFVLAASESLAHLDQALLRPGRLSYHVKLGLPTKQDIGALLRFFSKKLPLSDDVRLDVIEQLCTDRLGSSAAAGVGPTCATVSALCREAVQLALRERIQVSPALTASSTETEAALAPAIDLSRYSVTDKSNGRVTQAHFLGALDSFLPTPPGEAKGCADAVKEPLASPLSTLPPFEFKFKSGGGRVDLNFHTTTMSSDFKFDGDFNIGSTSSCSEEE